jgi:hypothetical protein
MGAYRGTATVVDDSGRKHAMYALLTSSTEPDSPGPGNWNGKLTGGRIVDSGAQITIQLPSGREGKAHITGVHGRDAALMIDIAGSGPPPFD